MSANNFIKIYKNEYNLWEVDECDAEEGIFMVSIGRGKTLEEAIEFANRYMQENEVEYGLRIVTPASQDKE